MRGPSRDTSVWRRIASQVPTESVHLRAVTKDLTGGKVLDMMPRCGNAGTAVRRNFTLDERINALDDFYRNFAEGRYYAAFRMELNVALARGLFQ